MLAMMGFMMAKLHSNSVVETQNLIGYMAEISVPVSSTLPGEVIYVIGAKRSSSTARALVPGTAFKKGAKVMISDIHNGVMMVEPWTYPIYDGSDNASLIESDAVINTEVPNKIPES